jgi:hypothetical protein
MPVPLFGFERFEKGLASFGEALFETAGAIAIGAGPGFGALFMAAIFAVMRVLHIQEVEKLFPIRTFFGKRRGAVAGFHPARDAVITDTGVLHIVEIFATGDGATAEGSVANGGEEGFFPPGFDAGFDQITHGER